MTRHVNIAEAKAKLSELVEAAAKGEEIVLARHGKPVARLMPLTPAPTVRRQFGQEDHLFRHVDWDTWWAEWKAADKDIEADFEASANEPLDPDLRGKPRGKGRRPRRP
ncbi:MAG: type II toxin-antitoxin system prevent-host-death family antitoxin [Alphaproteobacteria bacterium]|nr:type II toxin-antitoxin system prevent-host-death family antitoxin [Alphaproteobacteria bacterium]